MKKKKISILLFIILEILIAYVEKKYIFFDFGRERFVLLSFVNVFVCMHLFFPISKMYDFIYKKRYILATLFLAIFSFLQYHGSSIAVWDYTIQPGYHVSSGSIMLGKINVIRGDEFYVSTPTTFSQRYNDYRAKSNILMGREGYVSMFPTLPCWDISILGNICNIPYLLLPLKYAFACSWWLRLLLIFFASFELCMIVTNKNKLNSLTGAMMITFSGASCYWSNMLILGIGASAVIVFYYFFKCKKKYQKVLLAIMLGIIGANYLAMMYPAWMVPFGYIYLGFLIWIMIENRKELKAKMLLYLPIVLVVMFGIFIPTFLNSYSIYLQTSMTVYPGARLSLGGEGIDKLFSYYSNLFFAFKQFFNPSEYGNFMSFFPLPIIYSIMISFKKLKQKLKVDYFLVIMSAFAILLSVWNFVALPKWLSKLSLLSFSTPIRCQLVVGYTCIFMLVRIMSKHSKSNVSRKRILASIMGSLVFNGLVFKLVFDYFQDYISVKMWIVLFLVFIPVVTLIILNYKKTNKVLAVMLIFISILTGVCVNPLSKGIGVLSDKPVAIEIRNIVSNDKNARWLAVSDNYAIPNYLVANGARTINSTNYYPNLKLWNKIDRNRENEDLYNRYSHIQISLTNEETSFELLLHDYLLIHLNINDLDKLDVQYILSTYKLENLEDRLECIYDEYNAYIYKLID